MGLLVKALVATKHVALISLLALLSGFRVHFLLRGWPAFLGRRRLLGLDSLHERVDVRAEIDVGTAVFRLSGASHPVVLAAQVQIAHLLVRLDRRAHLGLHGLASAVQRVGALRQAGLVVTRRGLRVRMVVHAEVLVEAEGGGRVQRLVSEGGGVGGHGGLGPAGLEEG